MYLCKQSSVGKDAGQSSSTLSPVGSYLRVYVMEAPLVVPKRGTPVFSRQVLVCVCMYMYANTAERLRLQKAVSLLSIMKYFVLKSPRIRI